MRRVRSLVALTVAVGLIVWLGTRTHHGTGRLASPPPAAALAQVTVRSRLLRSTVTMPGVCTTPNDAPSRATVQVAPGGAVEIDTACVLPSTISAQAGSRAARDSAGTKRRLRMGFLRKF